MLKNPENFIIVTTGISLCFIFVNVETKRYINITANPQSDFQANPDEIWTFRSSSLKRSKRTFLAYGMGGVVKVSVREHTSSKKYWELCIPKSL